MSSGCRRDLMLSVETGQRTQSLKQVGRIHVMFHITFHIVFHKTFSSQNLPGRLCHYLGQVFGGKLGCQEKTRGSTLKIL